MILGRVVGVVCLGQLHRGGCMRKHILIQTRVVRSAAYIVRLAL